MAASTPSTTYSATVDLLATCTLIFPERDVRAPMPHRSFVSPSFRSTGAYSERVGRGALHDADVLGDGRRVRFGSHFVGIRHHMTFLLTKFEVSSQAMTTRTMDRMTSPAMS